MAKFYFELVPHELAGDAEGIEFATSSEATVDAAISLAQMMSDVIAQPVSRMMSLIIRDEKRAAIARLALSLDVEQLSAQSG